MRTAFAAYIGLVTLVAGVGLGILPWFELSTLTSREIIGVLSFILIGILAEGLAINFAAGPGRAERMKSSIAFLPFFTCAIIFPPAATVLVVLIVQTFIELVLRNPVFYRVVFNVSQAAVGMMLALMAYSLLGGEQTTAVQIQILPFGALALVFFCSNLVLVSVAFAISERQSVLTVLRHAVGPGGGNLFYGLLSSPVALVAALLYREFYEFGLILVLLPLLLIRSSYLNQRKLQQANNDLLKVLIKAIETRDPYTSGHSVRVSILARAIAEDLGMARRRIEQVERAALLHDIGKIDSVYADIISKSAALSEEERAVIQTHAVKGADLLESLASVEREIILAVRHHHERFDGRGYPTGLAGKAIPTAARIIMLCDSIDAMLSDRAYRKALTITEVRAELERCSGTQFDPEIVEVILHHNTLERAAALIPRGDAVPSHSPELQRA